VNAQETALTTELTSLQESVATMSRATEAVVAADPTSLALKRLQERQKSLDAINTKLAAESAGLIPPAQMAQVIHDVLKHQQGLALVSLKNLPVKTLVSDPKAADNGPYLHPVELVIEEGKIAGAAFEGPEGAFKVRAPGMYQTLWRSPLDWALYKGYRAKIQVLQEHGAMPGSGPRREEIPPPATGGIGDPRVSLTRSVSRLLDAAPGFREKTNCISCHHNAMPAFAAATARRKGIEVDAVRDGKNVDDILTFFKVNAPRMMLGDPAVGGEALTTGYAQIALSAGGHPLDTITATMTHWLIARQMPDGRWLGNGLNRPPSEYSTISHTAIAAGGLKSYPLPGRKDEIAGSLQRARQWLLAAEPKSAEERGMRLMGLVWTDAPRTRVAAAIKEIRDRQEASGGWSQFARTGPDAYATGLSLYALHVAGVPPTDAAYRKGVAFLLGSQYQDGAWLVKTHSFPVQRYFESGFPFGRHQWISSAGTSWASLAIAQTLPDRAAGR